MNIKTSLKHQDFLRNPKSNSGLPNSFLVRKAIALQTLSISTSPTADCLVMVAVVVVFAKRSNRTSQSALTDVLLEAVAGTKRFALCHPSRYPR